MSHQVTIGNGHTNVQLPNGGHYDAGDVVVLTDDQFDQIDSGAFSDGSLVDGGQVTDEGDDVTIQAAHVAGPAALTSSAPGALTSSAPSALTSSAPAAITAVNAAGSTPTAAEFNAAVTDLGVLRTELAAVRVDVAADHSTLAAAQVDVAALRTSLTAAQADVAALRTTVAALMTALTGANKPMAS